MLWIFDSWLGWLQTLKYLKDSFPDFDFIFYADNKNVPYWGKTPAEIKKLTYHWLELLFSRWASIVILACNTASACAIKSWQCDFPDKKVLSVTIPWVEAIIEGRYNNVWILATKATVESDIYPKKILELCPESKINIHQIAANDLVDIIEWWIKDEEFLLDALQKYITRFPSNTEALVLWCTHYPILFDQIRKIYSKPIIDPSMESVKKLKEYFTRHPEIYEQIWRNSRTEIFSSWNPINFDDI